MAARLALQRAVTAVEDEFRNIRNARPREGFPHAELVDALPDPDDLRRAADEFVAELLEATTDHTPKVLRNTTKQVATLHASALKVRSTLEWSSDFTAIDWWVRRRADELAMDNKHILIAPGALDKYHIEKTSTMGRVLSDLSKGEGMLCSAAGDVMPGLTDSIQALRNFHVLTVPASDGVSPLWHPVFLGHELAHLRFTDEWVHSWLASSEEWALSDMGRQVVNVTQKALNSEGEVVYRSSWIRQLDSWLIELACDTAAVHLYGSAGLAAIGSFLAGLTDGRASESHPSLSLRFLAQQAESVEELNHLRPDDPFADSGSRAADCFINFCISLRDHVKADLESLGILDDETATAVASAAFKSLGEGLLPASADWSAEAVANRAGSIESGLVRALWQRVTQRPGDHDDPHKALARDAELVSQAIDGLEFVSRFESRRSALGIESKDFVPLRNVLWVTPKGILGQANDPSGPPSYDLRLGRYFIVFQRNEVPYLNALGEADGPPPIQREIEVGWGDTFTLHPSELVLAVTFESLRVDLNCTAQVLSRSSLGRLGLLSATAVQVDPGFVGCLTLELVNLASVPLQLTPGQRIAQVVPFSVVGTPTPYEGSYQGAGRRPQFSLSRNDWEADVLRAMSDGGW